MLKIVTLAVVVFAVVLINGVYGGVGRRSSEDVTTKRPKLIRVPLKRYDPLRDGPQTLDVAPVSRPKRQTDDVVDVLKRGPFNSRTDSSDNSDDASFDEVSRGGVKGFEDREQEEKLAESEGDVVDDQAAEMTDGKLPTDDEKERFDVDSSTHKTVRKFDELVLEFM